MILNNNFAKEVCGQATPSNGPTAGFPAKTTAAAHTQAEAGRVNSRTKGFGRAVAYWSLNLAVRWARRAQAASPRGPWIDK